MSCNEESKEEQAIFNDIVQGVVFDVEPEDIQMVELNYDNDEDSPSEV
ncbi:MAG: hypothetical protein J5965_13570 [Aeriscardovia sp.]|nr:hypothetical protein [Aeriscardovia sp.]